LIIERYISKEILLSLFGVSLVLLLLVVGNRFMIVLGDAVSGGVSAQFVFSILYLNIISQLGFLIPFSYYLATLLALGRLYKDSEMSAFAACGVGYRQLVRATIFVGGICAIVVLVLGGYVSPWAVSEIHKLEEISKQQSDVQAFKSGEFRASDDGRNVVYIENVDTDNSRLQTIFAHGESKGQSYTVYADSGYQYHDKDTDNRYLVMQNGRRYTGKIGTADYQTVEFERYTLRLDQQLVIGKQQSMFGRSTESLLGSDNPQEIAELHWRIGLPIATFLLGFLAIPLSRSNPRQGRYAKLFVAILIFAVYVNLLGTGKVWIAKGLIPVAAGLWWVHILFLIFILMAMASQVGIRWRFNMPGVKTK